jgi:hypothetical protein
VGSLDPLFTAWEQQIGQGLMSLQPGRPQGGGGQQTKGQTGVIFSHFSSSGSIAQLE